VELHRAAVQPREHDPRQRQQREPADVGAPELHAISEGDPGRQVLDQAKCHDPSG
jgi:hypothetical protein